MLIKLNIYTLYVNFNKHKREYIIIPIRGVLLHLNKNNLIYHSTGKNTTGKIFTITQTQIENKITYHSTNK